MSETRLCPPHVHHYLHSPKKKKIEKEDGGSNGHAAESTHLEAKTHRAHRPFTFTRCVRSGRAPPPSDVHVWSCLWSCAMDLAPTSFFQEIKVKVKRQPPYVCEHLYCSPQRFVAQDTSTLNRHERRKGGGGHTCNATNCTTCKRWENHRLGKKNPNDLRFECRHSKSQEESMKQQFNIPAHLIPVPVVRR
ncbi:hypothetical protein QOT17_003060 [Balamuthia mandrillaris]